MMNKINLLLFCLVFISCGGSKLDGLDFLAGTWKVVDKEQYEVWNKEEGGLSGYSYTAKDGQKKTVETLAIKQINDQIVYEAIVPEQNEGKTIQFVLNTKNKDVFSFENLAHDFPKKIQYKKLEKNKLEVFVLGENDEGFSLLFIKQ
jgi:hypothetical protein